MLGSQKGIKVDASNSKNTNGSMTKTKSNFKTTLKNMYLIKNLNKVQLIRAILTKNLHFKKKH